MYQGKDPRADLFAATSKPTATGLVANEQAGLFYQSEPQQGGPDGKHWYLRGCNFVVAYSEVSPGAGLERKGQVDEYVLYLSGKADDVVVEWNGEKTRVPGGSIAFIPPGDSRIVLPKGGKPVRLFTVRSKDLAAASRNADAYDAPRTHIPPFKAWPEPVDGWKVRHYPLDVPDEPGRFGRIFRCTTFMVNALPTHVGPRDPSNMSPHHHDDFEQCSLALAGTFTHYLRWPWTTDMQDWQADKAVDVASPSAFVIPPPVIHTTRASSNGANELVDVFCPPRMDFSLKPGWVLNADDYPRPKAEG
ncbi:hypothetical protein [Rhizobium sp. SYY.PMSO]|uniref:hypothetical protein n=1 Tax=Rhizobium sp. SYY.PMSO TaxID=3382192 RepID=UPI00398FAAE2